MKKIIFASIFFIVSIFLFFQIQKFKLPKLKQQSRTEEIYGIDVSHFQGNIDWYRVSKSKKISYYRRSSNEKSERMTTNSKVEFVLIKATEGSTFVDEKFKNNLRGCEKYGIPRTGYHYYRFNSDPKSQARNFINNVPKSKINFPPAIDIEFTNNEKLKPSGLDNNYPRKKEFIRSLTILSNELENHYGQKPIFYTTPTIYTNLIKGNFPDNPIWISDLRPIKSPNLDWIFWQISFRGQIDGVPRKDAKGRIQYVDINKFKGNKKDFDDFVKKN